MKNTVYVLAKDNFTGSIEDFALYLSSYFLAHAPVDTVRIKIQEHLWQRLEVNGRAHEHSFTRGSGAVRTTRVVRTPDQARVFSGVRGLSLLKTTRSGFVGYIKDQYTTLPETTDRIFATDLNAEWAYASEKVAYDETFTQALRALTETFAQHDSLSVQHTMYAMGEKVLAECAEVARIRMVMPNKHHLLFDLKRFGMENANEIFVATTEPYGLIEAEVRR